MVVKVYLTLDLDKVKENRPVKQEERSLPRPVVSKMEAAGIRNRDARRAQTAPL